MEPFFLYILRCRDRTYYVGHTDNLEKRLAEHNNKTFEGYTSRRVPVELIFHQEFSTREEAFIAERKIKKWSRVKKEALIAGRYDVISERSKKSF